MMDTQAVVYDTTQTINQYDAAGSLACARRRRNFKVRTIQVEIPHEFNADAVQYTRSRCPFRHEQTDYSIFPVVKNSEN